MPSRQITPRSWGRVYWSGGAGKRSELDNTSMGGWRFHCNFCDVGTKLVAFGRKQTADEYLARHCADKHSYKTEVKALMERHADPVKAKTATGAAHGELPIIDEGEGNATR